MKEYEYSIIRRVSRNPKRNREGRGVSQSDLEALRQELAGDQRTAEESMREELTEGVGELTVSSEELRKRLETAEGELVKKLGSGDFAQWRAGEFATALAGKQPAGDYALTSELTTSAQQTLAEALKRAGEMDKQIKVGGRNLIVASRWKAGYLYGDRDENAYPVGSENYKVLVGYDTFRFDPVYIPTLGEREVTYKLYDNGGSTNGTVQIHAYDKDKKFLWWSCDGWDGTIGHTNAWTLPTDTAYIRLGVTNENVRAKVEFGTVVTDWTPAPEDVEEELKQKLGSEAFQQWQTDELAKALAGKQPLGDYALTSQLATSAQQTLAEALKRAGEMDKQIKVGGRNLLRDSGRRVSNADYVIAHYFTTTPSEMKHGDVYSIRIWGTIDNEDKRMWINNSGGDVGLVNPTYNESQNVWEGTFEWNDRHPTNPADNTYLRIYIPAHLTEGAKPFTTTIERIMLVKGNVLPQSWTPAPEDVEESVTSLASKLLDPQQGEIHKLTSLLESHKIATDKSFAELSKHFGDELSAATTKLLDLSSRSLTLQQKQDLGLLTSALRLKMAGGEGDKKTLEGLALLKYIALSGNNNDISAYLASDTLGAVLKAGVTGFGTPDEREQVEITHQGTGHFGNLYFTGSQIDFRTSKDADPYLSMGAEENQFIDEFLATARLDDTPVSVGTVTLSEKSKVYERTLSVDNDGTRLTVTIDELEVAVYETAKVRLLLDNDVLDTWMGITSFREGGGGAFNGVPDFRTEHTPYKGSNLSYERVVKAGSHTLRLEIAGKMGSDDSGATIKGLRIKRRYDTGRQQSAFAKNGLRLFGSPERYFDVDYREMRTNYLPNFGYIQSTNPYLVRIKGGAKVDRLTVDELDMPGVPLCGASFDENGTQIKAFGKYVNQRGTNRAQAVYYDNGRFFRVYHSIGHTRYLPTVQVIGDTGNDINWSLAARIYAVNANDFAVRIITNGDNPIRHAFSFVAFKTM